MKVLLVTGMPIDTTEYRRRLREWGIALHVIDHPFAGFWAAKEKKVSSTFLRKFAAEVYEASAEEYDVIQFMPPTWEGVHNLRGIQFHNPQSGYQTCVVRNRSKWEDTGLHELMHAVDDIILIYTGKDLSKIADVLNWDESVVHGKDRRYREYEYDAAYQIAKPHLFEAILIRKQRATIGVLQKMLQALRTRQVMNKPTEVIEEEPTHKLYKAAVAALGRDASPKDIVNDEIACVESLVMIIRTILVVFPFVTGTWSLEDVLRSRADCKEVTDPRPGDILVYVTGKGNGKIKNGHVLIVGKHGQLMSNDSRDGIWKQNYTLETADAYYRAKGGMKGYLFRLDV